MSYINIQSVTVDLNKRENAWCDVVRLSQEESLATGIKFNVCIDGASVANQLDGYEVYLVALLPDKRHYYRQDVGKMPINPLIVGFDGDTLCSVAGYTDEAYLVFEKDEQRISSSRFAIEVLASAKSGHIQAESYDDKIEKLIRRGEATVVAAEDATAVAKDLIGKANAALAAEKLREVAEAKRRAHERVREGNEAVRNLRLEAFEKDIREIIRAIDTLGSNDESHAYIYLAYGLHVIDDVASLENDALSLDDAEFEDGSITISNDELYIAH